MRLGICRMIKHTSTAATRLLHHRNTTWHTIRESGAHLLWLPRMVDSALNHFPGVTNIAALADSAAFHDFCKRDNDRFPYPIESWVLPMAREALSSTRLAQIYVRRQLASAVELQNLTGKLPTEIIPDLLSAVQSFWAKFAESYRPGKIVGDECKTWGYEAFLAAWLTPTIRNAIDRALRWSWSSLPLPDEDSAAIVAKSPSRDWEGTLRAALIAGLDDLITDNDLHAAYRQLAYEPTPMRKIAAGVGLTYHILHARLLQPLCARILREADGAAQGHVRFGRELREALAEVLPIHDFERRYLRVGPGAPVPAEGTGSIISKSHSSPQYTRR
jgi:hypothetical protein